MNNKNFIIRPATKNDAALVAKMFFLTSSEVLLQLFGEKYKKIVEEATKENDNFFSWTNAFVYEINGNIAGVVVAFQSQKENEYKNSIENLIKKNSSILNYLNFLITIKKFEKHFQKPKNSYYIQAVGVFKEFRGKGIARKLISYIENFSREQGFDSLFLEVVSSNIPAIKVYEKNGFIKFSKVKLKKGKMVWLMKKSL